MSDLMNKYRTIFSAHERKRFLQIIFLQMVGGILEMAAIYAMLPFVSAIMEIDHILDYSIFRKLYELFDIRDTRMLVMLVSIGIAGLYLVKNIYIYQMVKVQNRYIIIRRGELSKRIFALLLNKPYSYHVKTNTAAIQRNAIQDVDGLFGGISALFTLMSNTITAVLILAVLLTTSVPLTFLAIILVFSALLIINKIIKKRIISAGEKNRFYYQEQVKWINQATGGLKGIYANKRQGLFVSEYGENTLAWARCFGDYQTVNELPRRVIESVCLGGIFVICAVIILFVDDLSALLPVFATFALAAYRLMPIANTINNSISTINYNRKAIDQVYHTIVNVGKNDGIEQVMEIRDIRPTEILKDGIHVERIDFRFDDTEEYLYQDFSLFIPAQKSAAFIGTTGAGKTTLADIIMGLQVPQNGHVYVDGVDIYKEDIWWADRVGYIPQSIYLCDDTVRTNVAFGIRPEDIDDAKVKDCLKKAQLWNFVSSLPNGLDTLVGENGIRLSGGQRQRIGIARALYHDPPVLVMDEATSALDHETEQAIMSAISEFSGKKTLLIIAHRLTTIKDCDIVYKIEDGEAVVEKGNEYL